MQTKTKALQRLHEISQEKHNLNMEESKLEILHASQAAADMLSNHTINRSRERQKSVELSRTIDEVRGNLSVEEDQLRDSIETNERRSRQSQSSLNEMPNFQSTLN